MNTLPTGTVTPPSRLAQGLVAASAVVFAATGLAYLLVPGIALGIVAVDSVPATEFLLRTEGVALLFGAAMLIVVRRAPGTAPLLALSGYYLLSSIVDAIAFAQGIVGPASVPSVLVRIAVGLACLVVAVRARRGA